MEPPRHATRCQQGAHPSCLWCAHYVKIFLYKMSRSLSDPLAFAHAYSEHRGPALAAAQRVLRDPAAAEDVVQDVFAQLWRRPRAFDARRGSLRTYITMLARSRALDRRRRQTVHDSALERLEHEARGHEPSAAERAIERERRAWAVAGVERLPPPQREAVLLAFGTGMSAAEIGAAVGVPHDTAKSRVRLGLEKLRAA
jgi:RNA polymerase sigma-70 factor, ECF subfamily